MQTAKTLIRLGGCPGWSESVLCAHSFCWFCHEVAHSILEFLLYLAQIIILEHYQWNLANFSVNIVGNCRTMSLTSLMIQTHHFRIGHVTLIKYKYRQLYDKGKENERKMGSQNLLQCIYRAVHVYPSLNWLFFSFSGSRVCTALC